MTISEAPYRKSNSSYNSDNTVCKQNLLLVPELKEANHNAHAAYLRFLNVKCHRHWCEYYFCEYYAWGGRLSRESAVMPITMDSSTEELNIHHAVIILKKIQ